MALQKEVWIETVESNLFKSSAFLNQSINDSAYIHNKTVHIPQAGSNPGVAVDRAAFPATITQRTDSEITYNIRQYTTDPILIPDLDEWQISYNKRMDVVGQHVGLLDEVIGNVGAYAWAPTTSTKMVRTTGAASTNALAPGATGTRQAITLDDMRSLRAIFDNDLMPQEDRYILMPVDLYDNQLLAISDIYRQDVFAQQRVLPDGVVNRVVGFNILTRPTAVVYSGGTGTTQTLVGIDGSGNPQATGATQNLGAIAWHKTAVSTAKSKTRVFMNSGTDGSDGIPEYYGVTISMGVYHGASKRRNDNKGIAAIVQR